MVSDMALDSCNLCTIHVGKVLRLFLFTCTQHNTGKIYIFDCHSVLIVLILHFISPIKSH